MSVSQDSVAEAIAAVRAGDTGTLERLLTDLPELANARVEGSRTLLHILTDWPGNRPNSAETVAMLVRYGADVNAPFQGTHAETPLHWAASNDDVATMNALVHHGANIEAPGSVIGGGTPMADAVAFGCWQAARRLAESGAATTLWQAAALGLMDRVEDLFQSGEEPPPDEITNALWCACHGGQQAAAEYLLARGADLNWIGHDGLTPLDAAMRSGATELAQWLRRHAARTAK